jgi:hypothetical protein
LVGGETVPVRGKGGEIKKMHTVDSAIINAR